MADLSLPPRNASSPLADIRGHHVALRVPSFEQAIDFYVGKLDFRVVHQWPYADQKLAYLALPNDDHFMIELLAGGDPLPVPAPAYGDLGASLRQAGLHHFCLNVADMGATLAYLRARGVTVITEPFQLDVIGRKLAFIADPFGNLIELAQVIAEGADDPAA